MINLLHEISNRIHSAHENMDYLDCVFGNLQKEALSLNIPVILFGAGSLGHELCVALSNHKVHPRYFCDSDESKAGTILCGIPIISFADLKKSHKHSLIIIATKNHSKSVRALLLENGFRDDRLLCKEPDLKTNLAFLYSISITQIVISELRQQYDNKSVLDKLKQDEKNLSKAYNLFADQKSKDLFVSKLAFLASCENLQLFGDFIMSFSEPFSEFGFDNYSAPSEDYYYFNNDVFSLSPHETYVDVGAFDGDTVQTFIEACEKENVKYKHIFAMEPDPQCYQSLLKNTSTYKNISYHQQGLWSKSQTLQFKSSVNSLHDQAAAISNTGDMEIQVVSLDDFLQGREVTFIKMDPGGNVIPDAIKGASHTIARYKPKLAIGAYHAIESIYEIPLLIHSICPDYRLYLRHNTYHPCDTDLIATT